MPAAETDRASLVVAVDGPSGSGKSTVSRAVARALGLRYLDTGAIYRALTWWVLRGGVDPTDEAAVVERARSFELEISTDPADQWARVGDTDVTTAIRQPDVTTAVSSVSAVQKIRTQLLTRQRDIVGPGGIVVEGRDIGVTVCPDAPVKIFLTASAAARAGRRARAFEKTRDADVAAVQADLARRDRLDASRAASPLAEAADAVELDTTTLDLDQVVAAALALVSRRTGIGIAASEPIGDPR
jgi:cytidylate kinase